MHDPLMIPTPACLVHGVRRLEVLGDPRHVARYQQKTRGPTSSVVHYEGAIRLRNRDWPAINPNGQHLRGVTLVRSRSVLSIDVGTTARLTVDGGVDETHLPGKTDTPYDASRSKQVSMQNFSRRRSTFEIK